MSTAKSLSPNLDNGCFNIQLKSSMYSANFGKNNWFVPKRLIIVNPGHLANASRVQKAAAAAIKAGFEVFISGAWCDERLVAVDRRKFWVLLQLAWLKI